MAKIKMGALAQDARGSIAGNTFTKGRYGAVVRQKVSPVQPRTPGQLLSRANFSAASKAWGALTSDLQEQWANFAANHLITDVFGDSMRLSANAAYGKVNKVLLTLGLDQIDTPPGPTGDPGPAPTSAAATANNQTVTVTISSEPAADDLYMISTTRGMSPGARPQRSAFSLVFAGKPGTATTKAVVVTDKNPRLAFSTGQNVGVIVSRFDQDGNPVDTFRLDCVATAGV